MNEIERPHLPSSNGKIEWASDIAAAVLRALNIEYVALNPGASYRGLHDSLVNYLGNVTPKMLLCLNEDHVISIAHGYAKATDKPMAAVLHSNVGLLHGLMGIYNAWCDRVPMMVLGATGPVQLEIRRPWIDWIHTAKDQGALLRNYTKWDDEPRSPQGIVDGMLRAAKVTVEAPSAPVYVCLDAGLQETKLEKDIEIPDLARFRPAPPPSASEEVVEQVVDLIASAKNPVFLFGRGSRDQGDWDRRIRFAELCGASVLTSIRERSIFPTDHPLMASPPLGFLTPKAKDLVKSADLILSLDWVDLNGTFQQVQRKTEDLSAKIVHVSLDSRLHNGWSMDHFGLTPVDVPVTAGADAFVAQLIPALEKKLGSRKLWDGKSRYERKAAEYSADAATKIAPRDVEVALQKLRGSRKLSLAHATIGWAADVYQFHDPLDYLGHDGGAGLGAGPGIVVGAALALKDKGRLVVSVLGDGDFMQGVTALWTAAHYKIPALFIISNNRSNFNDEIHQETVAKVRNRPVENRWIGQRMDDPAIDHAGMARAQGIEAEGPIENVPDLERAIERGLKAVEAGRPYLIDAHVTPGYASPPLKRGE